MSYGAGYGRRRGSGLKIRLLIAAVMIGFSLLSYFSTGQVNPITGEKQRVTMTTEEEVAMGLQAAPSMIQQHQGMYPDERAQGYLDAVGAKLLDALNAWLASEGRTNPYRFEFHLLNDDQSINAFALPGGQVFITNALFSRLETEGQLAGVVGHEIGHVLSRHSAQRMAKQKLTSGITGAVGMAGGSYDSARMAAMIGNMINMKYGRQDELESDRWGVLLCAESGYDPRSMMGVMDILASSGGAGPPEMMSTHPKPANRKEYIAGVIREVFPNGLPNNLKP